jgi:selenocysteine-specific elongation factor
MPVIMGTAGHIDHGKTTLIKALTGIDCDRLAEEKKRGITIELGFAFMDLPGGARLGVVDVPGHERFVKNMVAGAAGIDFVLLVIAADEGIMPQTREHLEICSLLGISAGVVALTKVDMVEPEWLELVTEEVGSFLSGTFLAGSPVIAVSAHTGAGLDLLTAELAELAARFRPLRRSDLVRLPVDRVFTMKGYGTVATGTLISGKIAAGDDLAVYPRGLATKARNLQVHGLPAQEATAGQRTAVNLQGLEVEDVARGDVLARPGSLFPSTLWDVELSCLSSSPLALKHRTELHFHHGCREVLAKLHLLDRDKLEPGQTCVCQVRFPEPMAGVFGDRCVLRSFSPLRTVAGGKLIGPLARPLKRRSPLLATLAALSGASAEELILGQLALAGEAGVSAALLLILTNLESRELDKLLQNLAAKQAVFQFDREAKVYVHGTTLASLNERLLVFMADFHAKNQIKPGLTRSELASSGGSRIAPKLFHFLVERLLKSGALLAEAEIIRLPGHVSKLGADQDTMRAGIALAYQAGGLTPPNLPDVLGPLGVSPREAAPVFKVLLDQGVLLKIKEDMYFDAAAVAGLIDRVRAYFKTARELGPVEFKELTGLSRKYAIPLLEFFDKQKLTIRVGDKRQLRGN